jgi:hypothetical protein
LPNTRYHLSQPARYHIHGCTYSRSFICYKNISIKYSVGSFY